MSILKTTDFQSGMVKIAQSQYTTADLSEFISDEKQYQKIREILGYDLGQELIDDLSGDPAVPQTDKWTDIWDEFSYEWEDVSLYSLGIKEILKRLVYCDFEIYQRDMNTANGEQIVQQEASVAATGMKRVRLFNKAVESIRTIQIYVDDRPNTYSDFDGNYFEFDSLI